MRQFTFCLALTLAASVALAQQRAAPEASEPEVARPGVGIIPLPVIAYSPETELQVGAAAVTVFYPEAAEHRVSSLEALAIYSTNNSAALEANLAAFLLADRLFVGTRVELQRMPSVFYGVGNRTELQDAEKFTRDTLVVEVVPLYAFSERLPHLYLGPRVKLDLYELDDREAGGLLDTRAVVGAHAGRDVGLGAAGRYDSRDNAVNPYAGYLLKASATAHHAPNGSQFAYERYGFEGRTYVRTYREQVLALALKVTGLRGNVPYFNLLKLGGWETLRGHFEGRYRDNVRFVVQTEYRVPLLWRVGIVAFGGVGDVGSNVGDLLSHSLKYSVGGGLRLLLDRDARVNLALDFGYAGDQTGFYIELGEAF